MGLFKKKETTHFERDEAGNVIRVTHNGQDVDVQELKMKTGKQLEQEYYEKHPEKRHPTLRKISAGAAKLDKKIVEYNRRSNIMNPQRTGHRPPSFTFTNPSSRNANPFGNMFDAGMQKPKKKKSGKTKYVIRGGKAYPISGTGKRKSKKKSTKRKTGFGFDPIDNGWWS